MRARKVDERTIALQTGHSLNGIALQYGTKILRTDEQVQLAEIDLIQEWDFSNYEGILKKAIAFSNRPKHRNSLTPQ